VQKVISVQKNVKKRKKLIHQYNISNNISNTKFCNSIFKNLICNFHHVGLYFENTVQNDQNYKINFPKITGPYFHNTVQHDQNKFVA
jgi:hypothetical protein